MTAQPAAPGGQPRPQQRRGRSNAVAADYDWILGDNLFQAYCLTLDRGVTPQSFEPNGADHRWGSTPDACLQYMKQIGFNTDKDGEDTGATKTAAFALAERLTGVLVSDTMLYDDAEFLCGTVRIPD